MDKPTLTTLDTDEALREHGFDPRAVKRASLDDYRADADAARAHGLEALAVVLDELAEAPKTELQSPFLNMFSSPSRSFQATGLHGVVFCPCPVSGDILVSRHSFAVTYPNAKQVHLFHRFEGPYCTFYLVTAGWMGLKFYIYIPEGEVVITLNIPQLNWGDPENAIDAFRMLAADNRIAVNRYLASETQPALVTCSTDNLGHFLWNDLAGLLKAERSGLLDDVRYSVRYSSRFWLPEDILKGNFTVFETDTPDGLFRAAIENNLSCVRPTSLQLTNDDVEQIRTHSAAIASAAAIARSEAARGKSIVLWANLRAHNKIWVNQVDGILACADLILQAGRGLTLYLDGRPDCAALVQEIENRAPASVEIVRGIDVPLADSIVWAYACHAYIATIGSGLPLVTWVAGRPGVAHSERAHLNQMSFWPEVRPDAPAPLSPAPDLVEEIGEGAYCNYVIAPETVTELLREAMTRAGVLS